MSFLSYGMFFLGLALGGLLFLVIFSLMALAQKGDAYQEHMDFIRPRRPDFSPHAVPEEQSQNIRLPDNPDLRLVEARGTRTLLN